MGLQLLISGLALGSAYALLALSLVLIHKATGVINFAQGEMATFATFVLFALWSRYQPPFAVVLILSLPLGACIGALVERCVIRPMMSSPSVNILIVTIGLWITFNSAVGWIWGFDPHVMPSVFPSTPIDVFGARISQSGIGMIVVALAAMLALYIFFEYTRFGTAMRAATMNARAAELAGVNIASVSTMAWALGGALSALCGILVAPVVFLDHEMMVSLLLKAFAGAILGGFNSLPGAVVGALSLGVFESLFGALVSTRFKDAVALVIIVGALLIRPSGLFGVREGKKV